MDITDFLSPKRDQKRYAFVWNNEERTEAVIRDKKANELMLVKASEGTHSTHIVEELRKLHWNAQVLPEGQRLIVTRRGLFWQDGRSVLES